MLSKRLSGGEDKLIHQSNPHLNSNYWAYGQQSQSTFGKPTLSTFSHHKSGADLRYKDDPNPYKVSNIDEMRIQVQDPFRSKNHLNHTNSFGFHNTSPQIALYSDEDILHHSKNSSDTSSDLVRRFSGGYDPPSFSTHRDFYERESEYEIPVPDYEETCCSNASSSDEMPTTTSGASGLSDINGSVSGYAVSINSARTNNSSGISSTNGDEHETEIGAPHSPSPSPTKMKISEEDRKKIEHAFLGRKTSIYVSDSLANLYALVRSPAVPPRPNSTGSNGSGSSHSSHSSHSPIALGGRQEDWVLKYTGVPILLLDTGETKNRDKRKIQIVLAELGSGLALWKDVIDNLTSYKTMEGSKSFHTMHLSSDHTKVVGLSFDDSDSAERFFLRVEKLTSDFSNISLSGSKAGKKKKTKVAKIKPIKFVKPKKSEISQPCAFQHIATLNTQDKGRFSSLQNFVTSLSSSKSKTPVNPSPNNNSHSSINGITMGVGVLSLTEDTELSF